MSDPREREVNALIEALVPTNAATFGAHDIEQIFGADFKDQTVSALGKNSSIGVAELVNVIQAHGTEDGKVDGDALRQAKAQQKATAAASTALSSGWVLALNANGVPYYFNAQTGESSWERVTEDSQALEYTGPRKPLPKLSVHATEEEARHMNSLRREISKGALGDLPKDWLALTTDYQLQYFHNITTGELRWIAPSELDDADDADVSLEDKIYMRMELAVRESTGALPAGWRLEHTADGIPFYNDTASGLLSYARPKQKTYTLSVKEADATVELDFIVSRAGPSIYARKSTEEVEHKYGGRAEENVSLPVGWSCFRNDQKVPYFFNEDDKISQWTLPHAEDEDGQGEFDDASEELNRAADALYTEAKSQFIAQDHEEAHNLFTQAIEVNPPDRELLARCFNARGVVQFYLGNYEEAVEDASRAIELSPEADNFYKGRGNAYFAQEKYEESLVDFDRAIALKDNDKRHFNNRGSTYRALGRFSEAVDDYSKAIELDGLNDTYYSNRGNTYFDMEEWRLAVADFVQALELNPDSGAGSVQETLNKAENHLQAVDEKAAAEARAEAETKAKQHVASSASLLVPKAEPPGSGPGSNRSVMSTTSATSGTSVSESGREAQTDEADTEYEEEEDSVDEDEVAAIAAPVPVDAATDVSPEHAKPVSAELKQGTEAVAEPAVAAPNTLPESAIPGSGAGLPKKKKRKKRRKKKKEEVTEAKTERGYCSTADLTERCSVM